VILFVDVKIAGANECIFIFFITHLSAEFKHEFQLNQIWLSVQKNLNVSKNI